MLFPLLAGGTQPSVTLLAVVAVTVGMAGASGTEETVLTGLTLSVGPAPAML